MEIYLIRHTTPQIAKGICYGQSDLDVADSFEAEWKAIAEHIHGIHFRLYTSPLQRCYKLAKALFPLQHIETSDALKELHCGNWESQAWNDIDQAELQAWMEDFVNVAVPGGESYLQLYERNITVFDKISAGSSPAAIVTHGGVIRSILSYITGTALEKSFDAFGISYGSVFRLVKTGDNWTYDIIYAGIKDNKSRAPRQS